MVLLKDVKGQSNAVRFLLNCLDGERVPNAFLFSGPEGVGKALTAKALLAELFCREPGERACGECPACRRAFAAEHPDIIWLRPEKNKFVPIEEIRKAKDRLNLKPYEAPYGVCVIEDAHMMRQEAANAMLKVLEEPPEKALLILISSKKELLLPTVVSRCSEVRFRNLGIKETKEIVMKETGADEYAALFLASFSQGSPGEAIAMMKEGVSSRREGLSLMFERITHAREAAYLVWDADTKDALLEDIEIILMYLRDAAFSREGLGDRILDKRAAKMDVYGFLLAQPVDRLYEIMERLIGVKQALYGNANPKIIAQALPAMLK